jgi:CRP-like cAMP-binding protein
MADQAARERLIRASYLFREVELPVIDRLARVSVVKTLKRRETLFMQGDEADALYGVLDGLIRIWIGNEAGKELTLSLQEPGDAFGEIALLDGLPRTANATALEETEVLTIRRADFLSVLESDPRLARHIIELLCERLRRNTDLLGDFAFSDLSRRLARKLDELALAHGEMREGQTRLGKRFSQTDLARMLGVSREAVNKQLAVFQQKDLLSLNEGRLTILDLAGLRRLGSQE